IESRYIKKVQDILTNIADMLAKNEPKQNSNKNSDKQNALLEHDKALKLAIMKMMSVNMEIFKHFNDNESFRNELSNAVFDATYNTEGKVFNGEDLSF